MVQLYVRDSLVVTSVSRIAMQRRFFFTDLFLGAFANFRKAAVSFIMSVCLCLSVRIEQLSSHRTDFHEICYLKFFRKICREISNYNSGNNNWYSNIYPTRYNVT
jgi:hypothetical protein